MPCSAITLSIAAITSLFATIFLITAFATDNWLMVDVNRNSIRSFLERHNDTQSQALLQNLQNKYYYYTRTKGLFRICYPNERPKSNKIYLSPVETYCNNINYYVTEDSGSTKDFTDDAWTRLHMARSVIALFILTFITVSICFFTGIAGCWCQSPSNITATALLMLLACLLSAGAMGLWHGVEYYEKEKVVGEEFYQQWSSMLRENSRIYYDWSYMLAWVGVSFTLIAAILFSGAAICLRNERDKEDAINMQYLMPVYPQKQAAYAYPGYPATNPQAYSGPYYHTSLYNPYSY